MNREQFENLLKAGRVVYEEALEYKTKFQKRNVYKSEKALKIVQEALEMDPDSVNAQLLKGEILHHLFNDHGQAVKIFQKILESFPNHQQAQKCLASAKGAYHVRIGLILFLGILAICLAGYYAFVKNDADDGYSRPSVKERENYSMRSTVEIDENSQEYNVEFKACMLDMYRPSPRLTPKENEEHRQWALGQCKSQAKTILEMRRR